MESMQIYKELGDALAEEVEVGMVIWIRESCCDGLGVLGWADELMLVFCGSLVFKNSKDRRFVLESTAVGAVRFRLESVRSPRHQRS